MDFDASLLVTGAGSGGRRRRLSFRLTPIVTTLFALAFAAWCWSKGHG